MLKQKLCRKRGSYIVEAALIYPVIVIITALFLLLMIFFFNSVQDMSQLDSSVRTAAEEASETVILGSRKGEIAVFSGWSDDFVQKSEVVKSGGLIPSYSAQVQRKKTFTSLIPVRAQSRSKAVWTSLDEDDIIRTADLVFEKIGNEPD